MTKWKIYNEDAVEWAKNYQKAKFHALLCDAPYHLTSIVKRFGKKGSAPAKFGDDGVFQRASKGFMGSTWDGGDLAFRPETWEAFGNVLHDGAFGMAFSASRNWHRMAVAIEDAGFILHPTIFLWAYGQGFPKATRVKGHEEFDGHRYGLQALKPACEPIVVFSKSKGLWYTSIQDDMNGTSNLLGELWTLKAENQEKIGNAAQEVNTTLLQVLNLQDPTYKESGLSVGIATQLHTKHQELSNLTVESEEGIAQGNATKSSKKRNQKEFVNNAETNLESTTRHIKENIVVGNVLMPHENAPCWKTPFGMGIDIDTLVGILLSSLEKAKLDLSMIWLWNSIWADICELVNKYTIEMSEKTITELKILNYSLQRLTQISIQLEKNSSKEQWLYAQDVVRNFIGLLTSLTILEPIVTSAISPIIVFQKPYNGKSVENIVRTGAGALNVDGGRIPTQENVIINRFTDGAKPWGNGAGHEYDTESTQQGRWPSNLILTEESAEKLDAQTGILTSGALRAEVQRGKFGNNGIYGVSDGSGEGNNYKQSEGGASRFFYQVSSQLDEADPAYYCAKVSPKERNAGLDDMPNVDVSPYSGEMNKLSDQRMSHEQNRLPRKNTHPTLKPIDLCRYLATLLLPPVEYAPRRIFVPFSGSGSEMIGCGLAGWEHVVGVEFDTENDYVDIAEKRLEHWLK